jgi:hypothetical protein
MAHHVHPDLVLIREFGLYGCGTTLSEIAQQDHLNMKFFISVHHNY